MNKLFILLFALSCAQQPPSVSKTYHRKEWKHWTDTDRDCLDTRNEILKSRSLVAVKMNKRGCKVAAGKWADYYYPEVHTNPKKIDIDHVVPLKNAHDTGGAYWTKKEKETFANDPQNLVITNRSYNRKKGSKGVDGWLPVHQEYACKYIKDWIIIKNKYGLKLTHQEQNTIKAARCN
ncbi:MAG: HNH endonuclease family protein [Bacteriovoracaceae bacterium]|nr:HNH endonuclease family protein [Bacteriovoracaceae bacterium]